MNKHKHHIIPRYRCKELGIDPDFDENIVEVTREDHALIHWGYKCDDLEPLFEYVIPPQWIIDLIPRGDKRDMWAAQVNAKGEIDGIDMSGENHPMYGRTGEDHPSYGIPRSEETKKKISDANIGKVSPFKGKSRSEYTKEYEDFIEKMSGENHWTYGMEPGEHPNTGIPRSVETKKKISDAHTGKTVLEETKEKLRIVRSNQLLDEEYLEKWKRGVKAAGLLRRGENNHMYGKTHSKEVRKKISNSRKGKCAGKDNHNYGKTGSEVLSYTHGKLVNARNDPEVRRAYKAEWYQKNKEKHKAQCRLNRAKKKADTQSKGTLEAYL